MLMAIAEKTTCADDYGLRIVILAREMISIATELSQL